MALVMALVIMALVMALVAHTAVVHTAVPKVPSRYGVMVSGIPGPTHFKVLFLLFEKHYF